MKNWLEKVGIKNITGSKDPMFILIAGPCIIRDPIETRDIASAILEITESLSLPFVFKASFDKANRTSINSYRGLGAKRALAILHSVRESLKLPVLTDIHNVSDAALVEDVVDFIQIPAFLCRQTDLILAAARTNKIINIKKGTFLSPYEIEHIVEKIRSVGNSKYLITERGTSFGYNELVNDFRSFPIMNKYAPVLFDATHSIKSKHRDGREFIPALVRASIAAGACGLYMEVHFNPSKSLSDADSIFPISKLKKLLKESIELYQLIHSFKD